MKQASTAIRDLTMDDELSLAERRHQLRLLLQQVNSEIRSVENWMRRDDPGV